MHFLTQSVIYYLLTLFAFFVASVYLTGCALVVTNVKDVNLSTAKQSPVKEDFDPLNTPLGKLHTQDFKQNTNKSGAILIPSGKEALLHRAALARMASKSILLQTYIYKNDPESRLLMFELLRAANRGVEVKILIDDNGLDSDFSDIITLDSHPNIQVKIFNPYANRYKVLRYAEMIYDFKRITHRMHNKIFVADNLALIIGGRNVADNYFDTDKNVNFTDCDAIFIGPVAREAVQNFKLYWEFEKSVPASLLPSKLSMKNYMQNLELNLNEISKAPQKWQIYDEIMQKFLAKYQNKGFEISWGKAYFLGDLPQKIQGLNFYPLSKALNAITNSTQKSMYIASAYFVPGKDGLKMIEELRNKGIEVLALTNSLASVDSAVVYAAWQRYRDKLLDKGVKVYEYAYHGVKKSNLRDKTMSSNSSFHSKIITFDEQITWIGSFNLDPRSHNLNTESIVVFENSEFARLANENILADTKNSWQLVRENGKTTWQGFDTNGVFKIYTKPPDTSIFLRGFNFLSKILPESQI